MSEMVTGKHENMIKKPKAMQSWTELLTHFDSHVVQSAILRQELHGILNI